MRILLVDNGQPFNLDTPYFECLGGSETSLLLLSKGLAELDQSVVLLTNSRVNVPQYDNNLILHNINAIDQVYNEADVIIFNRSIIPEILFTEDNKKKYCYTHDAYDQIHITATLSHPMIYNSLDGIICVSEWQKTTFNKYLGIPLNKMMVLGNSIDSSLYQGYVKRNENKLIFASIPYKGIEVLKDIFNDVCVKSKRKDLEFHIFSSMKLYNTPEKDKDYEIYFSELSKTKGVYLHSPVSMRELAVELMSASLYIHPSTYHETFGMLLTMSQAAGCLPVTVNNGAASEMIENNVSGFFTKGKTIHNFNCYNEFIDIIVSALNKDLYKKRLDAMELSTEWNYINIANKLLSYLR